MPAAAIQRSSYLESRESLRSRAVSLALALAITALIVFLMIEMGVVTMGRKPSQPTITMIQIPGEGSQPTPAKAIKPTHATHGGPKTATTPTRTNPTKTPPHHATPTPVPWNVIPMSSSEFASSDIASMPSHRGERIAAAGDGGDTSGAGSGTGDGAGGAPGGDEMLSVDWYRRPTPAELDPYMPRVLPVNGGWGEIECTMIADYRVEDCKELGETPGSGISRMMRQASWQFRVLPPRRNGKQVLGGRVRIHYTLEMHDTPGPG